MFVTILRLSAPNSISAWDAYTAPETHYLYLRGLFPRGWRGKGRRLAGKEGITEGGAPDSVKHRAHNVASTLLMLRLQRGLVKKINAIIFGPPL